MLTKSYYRLDEASHKLHTDPEGLIDLFYENKCQICIMFSRPGLALTYDMINCKCREAFELSSNVGYPIVYGSLERSEAIESLRTGALISCPLLYIQYEWDAIPDFTEVEKNVYSFFYPAGAAYDESSDDDYWDWGLRTLVQISAENFVITRKELMRLLDIPTYEHLKNENEALKQRIDELEAKQSTYSTEPNATSKASINAFFKGLNASYGKSLDVARIVEAADKLGEKISDKTIYKYLDKGV